MGVSHLNASNEVIGGVTNSALRLTYNIQESEVLRSCWEMHSLPVSLAESHPSNLLLACSH